MANANAAVRSEPLEVSTTDRLEQAGLLSIFGMAAALQFSIAVAQSLLAVALLCWLALVFLKRERVVVPRFFWPLLVYATLTLLSAAFSPQVRASLEDSKEIVLFLIVPLVYRFVGGARGDTLITIVVSVGAASAALGIVEYVMLGYNHLNNRPRGLLGHYMTYSGLLMLVIGAALSRILFGKRDRLWALLVMPALAVAVAFSFGRSAAIGTCAAVGVLLALRDYRLMVLLPIAALVLLVTVPGSVSQRFKSILDPNDPTRRDRVAMLKEGAKMVRDHPLLGVGPDMVVREYARYREPDAVEQINPHLHNNPVQIAAERGLPALVAWLWFLAVLTIDVWRGMKAEGSRVVSAAAFAAVVSMLSAGLFEYNFGDSEFLMLFLILVTLPFTASRPDLPARPALSPGQPHA